MGKKGQPMKGKPLKKGSAMKAMKKGGRHASKLSSQQLKKLGSMSLKDKIEKAGEHETPEEAGKSFQKMMSKVEKSNLNNKYQRFLKDHPEEEEAYKNASKPTKGDMSSLWLLKKEHPKFMNLMQCVEGSSTARRKEKWVSEMVILQQWTWDELQMHLQSGRIQARECPTTYGVWEYCDMAAWTSTKEASCKKRITMGQEHEASDENEKMFEYWHKGHLQSNVAMLTNFAEGSKGTKGKGKKKGKPKGGKGKGHREPLAIEDGNADDEEEKPPKENTAEEQHKEALKKAKKARDLTASVCADLEDCLGKANPYLTKAAKQKGLKDQQILKAQTNKLKELLAKENMPLSKMKAFLQENATTVKDVKDTLKELKQLANKANSVASKASKASAKTK